MIQILIMIIILHLENSLEILVLLEIYGLISKMVKKYSIDGLDVINHYQKSESIKYNNIKL